MTNIVAKDAFRKGLDYFDLGDYRNAEQCFRFALQFMPQNASILTNLAIAISSQGRFQEALELAEKAAAIKPSDIAALDTLAHCYLKEKQFSKVIDACDRIVAAEPGNVDAHIRRGVALGNCGRFAEALESYDRAIGIDARNHDAYINSGNALQALNRYDDAIVAYDRALALSPLLERAWLGRANVLSKLNRHEEALADYEKALALKPDQDGSWLGRGNVLFQLDQFEDALAAYDKALALNPGSDGAWAGRGNVLSYLDRHDEAVAAYDKALAMASDLDGVAGSRLYSKMHLCDWSNFETERADLISRIRTKNTNMLPFGFLGISPSPQDHLRCTTSWMSARHPPAKTPVWQGERYRHDRIQIAYLSADFHQNAMAYLAAGMFESHDRSLFETTAIAIGPDDGSQMRKRLIGAFDRFLDARHITDFEIASRVRDLEIDILVDLTGLARNARTDILAMRAAPVQVSYLGYPGTMAAPYIDYVIADRITVPEGSKKYFAEKVVYLPDAYQVNDRRREISTRPVTRDEYGLPEAAFVFCCFNNNYKITPSIFELWMRLLEQVDGSVLWLLEENPIASRNLRRSAEARGISLNRIVFAKRVPLADHLGRHRLADLFLDTLPYNAHTTASDALWAGLPIVTRVGEAFAGRVAASLLTAIGLPELITTTADEYCGLAIELAKDTGKLAAVRQKLAENRLTRPLFDTERFTRRIETAYALIHARSRAGLPPDHITVPK